MGNYSEIVLKLEYAKHYLESSEKKIGEIIETDKDSKGQLQLITRKKEIEEMIDELDDIILELKSV